MKSTAVLQGVQLAGSESGTFHFGFPVGHEILGVERFAVVLKPLDKHIARERHAIANVKAALGHHGCQYSIAAQREIVIDHYGQAIVVANCRPVVELHDDVHLVILTLDKHAHP